VVINLNNNEIRILPIDYLNNKFETLFKTGEIKRNYLGVNYLDLSSVYLFDKRALNLTQGALITKNKNKAAVSKSSPAEKAGLRENDIVLAVEKESLTSFYNLTELIQQYKEGSEVTLKVKRQDKIINIIVKLETK
jgi:serine protease Do